MKTISSLFVLTVFAASLSVAAETRPPITVGVFLFDSAYKVKRRNVTDLITVNLTAEPQLALVERAELDKIITEQAMGRGGLISADSAARVSQLTGAKILVTGRVFKSKGDFVLTARIIGTETGRVFTKTAQGPPEDLVNVTSALSKEIAQTITAQAAHLLARPEELRDKRIEALLKAVKGRKRPAVQIKVVETIAGEDQPSHTVRKELAAILQKAGFQVLDGAPERPADILLVGEAVASVGVQRGALKSSRAIVELRAQQSGSGRMVAVERQEAAAAEVDQRTAARVALESATCELARRLLPLLAK